MIINPSITCTIDEWIPRTSNKFQWPPQWKQVAVAKCTRGEETTKRNKAIGPTITAFNSGDLSRMTGAEGRPPIQSDDERPHWHAQTLDDPLIWYGAGAIRWRLWLCRRSIQHQTLWLSTIGVSLSLQSELTQPTALHRCCENPIVCAVRSYPKAPRRASITN